jgi:hypothetical protein
MIPGLLENSEDTKILFKILNYLKPNLKILESGLFLGSWCINVNNYLKNKSPTFYGIDDLSFIDNHELFEWYKNFNTFFKEESKTEEFLKIKTIDDLKKYIEIKSLAYCNTVIDINSSTTFFSSDVKFDVIHHDCANGYWGNDHFYKYYCHSLNNDGILVIDNFGCDVPMRTISISKYIENKTFHIIGSGRRKLFLSRNIDQAKTIVERIKNSNDLDDKFIFAYDYQFDHTYFYHPPDTNDL